jgi:parvulin-like peptidyl-prolyl isomerase
VLPDDATVQEATKALAAGEDFGKVAGTLSAEAGTKSKSGDLGWVTEGFTEITLGNLKSTVLEKIAFSQQPGTVSAPTYDASVSKKGAFWVIQVTEKDKDTSCHVRAILTGSLQDANDVKAKLKGGADFAALVKELSQHTESRDYGGDLGWVQKGFGNEAINKIAFNLAINEVSEPIYDKEQNSTGGFWLVKVLEFNPSMQVDADLRGKKSTALVYDWLEKQRSAAKIDVSFDVTKKNWVVNQIIKGQK